MPTICSAICTAMRVGVKTVGTSTKCSANCGSGTRERDGQGEQEILGTSITCSAIGKSRIRRTSVTESTIRSTGRSRICTNGARSPRSSMKCRTTSSCLPATSDRGAGRPPPGSFSRLKSSGWCVGGLPDLRRAVLLVPPPRPWHTSNPFRYGAYIRSCRSHERSRRCRRRIAAPVALPTPSMVDNLKAKNHQHKRSNLSEPWVVVVVVWWWWWWCPGSCL